jgi:hypothetical protein
VQECTLGTALDAGYDCPDQPRRDPVTAVGRGGAYGADFCPALNVQPLARHRDELTVAADPVVPAELDGSA